MVQEAARKLRRPIIHACLMTRLPAALKPRSLRQIVEMLKEKDVAILPTALIEKEAFRTLFAEGGGLDTLEAAGVHGAASAHLNAAGYVEAVLALIEPPEPPESEAAPQAAQA